jgi:hypothetical protein
MSQTIDCPEPRCDEVFTRTRDMWRHLEKMVLKERQSPIEFPLDHQRYLIENHPLPGPIAYNRNIVNSGRFQKRVAPVVADQDLVAPVVAALVAVAPVVADQDLVVPVITAPVMEIMASPVVTEHVAAVSFVENMSRSQSSMRQAIPAAPNAYSFPEAQRPHGKVVQHTQTTIVTLTNTPEEESLQGAYSMNYTIAELMAGISSIVSKDDMSMSYQETDEVLGEGYYT